MINSIRLFLSSTFLDMQEERDYLNRIVFPKFKIKCQARGVSFFACDLRWGITEAQAENKRTIELCLNQVERSIPFFIGLFGNRYGWIPESEDVSSESLEWYDDSLRYSATEIEFTYFCKQTTTFTNSFFAQKSDSLLSPVFDDNQGEKMHLFLERIRQESGRELFRYDHVEQLGDQIYAVLTDWLDTLFPEANLQIQMAHYRNLLSLRYEEHKILEQWQRREMEKYDGSNVPKTPYNPFRYVGDSYSGYEYFGSSISTFKFLALIEPEGRELVCNRYWDSLSQNLPDSRRVIGIYLDASPNLCNAYGICEYLRDELVKMYPNLQDEKETKELTSQQKSMDTLRDQIESILVNIPKERPLAICVTNLHLMNPADVNYNLSFLGFFYGKNVSIYLSTSDRSQTVLLAASGVYVVRNYPVKIKEEGRNLLTARLQQTLQLNGKAIEQEYLDALMLSTGEYSDDDISLLSDYLINYTIHETVHKKILTILEGLEQKKRVADIIYQEQLKNLSGKEIDTARTILSLVNLIPLDEGQLHEVISKTNHINPLEFANALNAVRPVLTQTDYGFVIRDPGSMKELQLPSLEETMVDSLCEILFDRLHQLKEIPQLETAYVLMNLILQTKSGKNAISFARDSTVFFLARKYDFHLLRRIWMLLVSMGIFDVEKLYPDDFSYENPVNYGKCDLIMKLEHSIFMRSEMEMFLDIPTFYSTDIEEQYKQTCRREEVKTITQMRQLREKGRLASIADEMRELVKNEDVNRDFLAYVYEHWLAYEREQGVHITKEEIEDYFFLAFYRNNLRMIADALHYFGEYVEEYRASADYDKALSRFQYL